MAIAYKKEGIALIILAAGASTRMKDVKQLLPWKNTTILGNAIEQGLASDADSVFVVLGANFELIRSKIHNYPVTILKNSNWKSGLGASISCAVNYVLDNKINFDGLLIMLADQPLIDTKYLNSLIKTFKEANLKQIVSTAYNTNVGVPAIFPATYYQELSTLNNDTGAKHILNSSKNIVKVLNASQKSADIDTIEDYKKLIN
jgi:molybdenum cofactor cytidylyltransferase